MVYCAECRLLHRTVPIPRFVRLPSAASNIPLLDGLCALLLIPSSEI